MDGSVCCVRGFAWLSFGVHSFNELFRTWTPACVDTSLALPVLPGYHAEGSAVSSIFAAQGNLAPFVSSQAQSSNHQTLRLAPANPLQVLAAAPEVQVRRGLRASAGFGFGYGVSLSVIV